MKNKEQVVSGGTQVGSVRMRSFGAGRDVIPAVPDDLVQILIVHHVIVVVVVVAVVAVVVVAVVAPRMRPLARMPSSDLLPRLTTPHLTKSNPIVTT